MPTVTQIERRHLFAGLAAAVTAGAAGAAGAYRAASHPNGSGATAIHPGNGHLTRLMVRDSVGVHSPVIVWHPPVPESADLPVVYLLHGVPGDAPGTAATGIVAATAAAIRAGAAAPVVLAIPDGNGRCGDTEWADASDGRDLVATRVVGHVLPAVEFRHPRPRQRRALVGFSMGGFGAANLGLQHPDLFSQWVSLDGYFRLDDPDGAFGDAAARGANTPDRRAGAAASQRVLLVEDTSERSPVRGEAVRMHGLLTDAGSRSALWTPPGSHSWDFVLDQWAAVLRWLDEGWS